MDSKSLFTSLFHSESEDEVVETLENNGLWSFDKTDWKVLGGKDNNSAIVHNQTIEPQNALVEKLTNSVDAMILLKATEADEVDKNSPNSVREAVERYFDIPEGKLENLQLRSTDIKNLTKNIQFFATGTKNRKPSITIADSGIGQSVDTIEKTFLSINETNKTNVPYLQGSFNQGGLATLVFSGKHRINLIATRMAPSINKNHNDEWCFTIIRYVDPEILGKEVPIYHYLAPKGKILTIGNDPIPALPDKDKNAYKVNLEHGAIVKCYSYDSGNWGGTENIAGKARLLMEELYSEPVLPIRFVDCRLAPDSWAETNFYGYWAQAKDKLHDGKISLNFDGDFGKLKVYYGVFDYLKTKDKKNRVVSSGIHFTYNGQSHGLLSSEFISKKNMLNFPFLKDRLRIDVEFNQITANYRTKIFSSSRDRIIKSDEYHEIRKIVINSLREKDHLKNLNAYYQSKINDENTAEQNVYFDKFLQKSEHIADFLSGKTRKQRKYSPEREIKEYEGKIFPTFFNWSNSEKEQEKIVPINSQYIQTFATTDAENLYFDRALDKGEIKVLPEGILKSYDLINGKLNLGFNMPNSSKVGQKIKVKIKIADKVNEFELSHIIEVGKKVTKSNSSAGKKSRKVSDNNQEIDNTGGIPVPRRLDAETLKEQFPDSFKDTYSVFCVGDQWFLNKDNKDLNIAKNDKNFKDYGYNNVTDAFETSLLLYGLTLKKDEASDVVVNESLSKMAELTIPIVDGLNLP